MVSSFVELQGHRFYRRDIEGVGRKHGFGVYVLWKCVDLALPNASVVHLIDLCCCVIILHPIPGRELEVYSVLLFV